MSRRLYHFPECPYCQKVRGALDRLGLDYHSVVIDPDDRSEVIRVSGQPKVPVLADGDVVIADSTRIFRYLVSHDNGADLLPDDPRERALAWIVEGYADEVLGPLVHAIDREDAPWPPDTAEGAAAMAPSKDDPSAELRRELGHLEVLLTGRDYVLSDSPTLADLALHAFLSRLEANGEIPVPADLPRLRSWYGRMRA